MKASDRQLLRAWIPTILWLCVIAFESTSALSAEHTGSVMATILNWLGGPSWAAQAPLANHALRKLGHFSGYGILSAFAFLGWSETLFQRTQKYLDRSGSKQPVRRRWHLRAAVLAVLVAFVVASLDEFHQSFIPGRTGVFRDVVLDSMGGVFAQLLILLFWKPSRKKIQVLSAGQEKASNAATLRS